MYATRLVVLAAGFGSRLGHRSGAKPLARIGGMTLLERAIVSGHEAGFDEIVVVTGHRSERVAEHALDVSRRRRVTVTVVRNDRYQEGNGLSVLAAREAIGADQAFALVMADHVFAPGVLRRLRGVPAMPDGVIVGADPTFGRRTAVDVDDAMKLSLDGERVVRISKDLPVYDAFDVGAFICTPAIFTAIEKSVSDGDASLGAAVQVLADAGAATAMMLRDDEWWFDVDTPHDRRQGDRFMFRGTGKALDGAIAARLNRALSQRLATPALLKTFRSITPNQVTTVAFFVAVAAGVAFALEAPLVAALLITVASVLDGSDGEVARLTRRASPFGAFFDAVLDRAADGLLFTGAAVYLAAADPIGDVLGDAQIPVALGVTGLALVGHLLVSYTTAKAAVDLGHRYRGALVAGGKGRDLRLFVVTVGAVAAVVHPMALLLSFVVLAALCAWIVVVRLRASWWAIGPGERFLGVQAVAFDFDGTLADSMGALADVAVELLCSDLGVPADDARPRYLATAGDDFRTQLERIAPGHAAAAAVAERFEARKDELMDDIRPFADARAALERLGEAGIPVLVCSSTRVDVVTNFCRRHRLDGATTTVDGWRPGRPKAKQLAVWAASSGVDASNVLFVGDARRDADIAAAAGVRFVGLARPGHPDSFAGSGLPVVHSLTELAGLVGRARRCPVSVVPSGSSRPAPRPTPTATTPAPSTPLQPTTVPTTPSIPVTTAPSDGRRRWHGQDVVPRP